MYHHMISISKYKIAKKNDIVIPCSSGGAFTTFNQTFEQKLVRKF